MGANIITGYTGTRHITPAMDAASHRSMFGGDSYILTDGNKLRGSMPSINQFTVMDGIVSMQGHFIQVTQETLEVDTCATGYNRIDLVALRFTHDNISLVDAAELVVIKGVEVADPNDPVTPAYNTGTIDSGASVVDMPLYKITLAGATVTFTGLAETINSTISSLEVLKIDVASFSSLPQTVSDDRISGSHEVINSILSDPSAQTGDWTVTTSDGSMTIAGSISGTTTASIYLAVTR